jgi:heterodisulfide reductase subunit B
MSAPAPNERANEYALFIGCTIATRGLNYEVSARHVADAFGIKFVDIPGFSCCGYPMSHVDHDTAMSIAARNLVQAQERGLDVITLCSACTGALTKASKVLAKDEHELARVNRILRESGSPEYRGKVKVTHFTRVLFEWIGAEAIKKRVTRPLTGLRFAPHHGCHYERPAYLFDGFDSAKRPHSLETIIAATGATPVRYLNMERCCGGDILAIEEKTATKVVNSKLKDIQNAGADAMVLQCPFCSIMYDEYQATIEEQFSETYKLPVLYLPQVVGLAMGMDPKKDLGMNLNNVKPKALLARLGVK